MPITKYLEDYEAVYDWEKPTSTTEQKLEAIAFAAGQALEERLVAL